MTDFFSELEGHLHRAARRRARRAHLAGPVAIVAVVAVLLAGVAALGRNPDPEVAAPTPTPTADAAITCGNGQIPVVLMKSLGVLHGGRTGDDALPPRLERLITGDLPGGKLEKVWTSDARLAHATQAGDFWIVPAIQGPCEKPEAVACVLWDDGRIAMPACVTAERLQNGELIAQGELPGKRYFSAALLPDGATPDLLVGGVGVEGKVEGNIFFAAYEAFGPDHEHAYLSSDPPPSQRCGDAVPTFTEASPAGSVLEAVSVFRTRGPKELAPQGIWFDVLAGYSAEGVHSADGLDLGRRGGYSFQMVPVGNLADECPSSYDPAAPDNEPGVCIGHRRGDGAATETGAGCWTMEQIVAGEAVGFQGLDGGRLLAYAVVDDSIRDATLAGHRMEIAGNFGYVVFDGAKPEPKLALVR
jgi:hypothetical protein